MAAHDPAVRRQAATTAARARLQQLTPEQRREMTARARQTIRDRDLATVDRWAQRTGRTLTEHERQAHAKELMRRRMTRASKAAAAARTAKAANHEGRP